jgi:hypothetical protein
LRSIKGSVDLGRFFGYFLVSPSASNWLT